MVRVRNVMKSGVLRTAPADTMSRATFALVLALLQPAYSQFRCHLGDVRKSDGTYSIGNCDELLLHGEKIGDEGTEALAAALPSAARSHGYLLLLSWGIVGVRASEISRTITTERRRPQQAPELPNGEKGEAAHQEDETPPAARDGRFLKVVFSLVREIDGERNDQETVGVIGVDAPVVNHGV